MASVTVGDDVEGLVARAEELLHGGEVLGAIDLLTAANRRTPRAELERALVRIRRAGCAALPTAGDTMAAAPVAAAPHDGRLIEIEAADLDVSRLEHAMARSGCLLVRGLIPKSRVDILVAGIDAVFDAYDASVTAGAVDATWYSPFDMPDTIAADSAGEAVRISPGSPPAPHLPVKAHRRFTRDAAGVWTVDSPRMLFEFLEVVHDLEIDQLITEYLGERPFLSANKCTLRRVPPEEMMGGWHQDGAFLGDDIASLNVWLALSACGRDAPGLDIVPRRFDGILESGGSGAFFKWSLSEADIEASSGGAEVVRPEFQPGDALLFDHRLVHRTGTSPDMTRERHAIESWFFGPSAFPASQLPLVC